MCSLPINEDKWILVTGGAGFLGSHLCKKLLEDQEVYPKTHVICLDNFSTGSKDNIEEIVGHPRFTFIEHDICHPLSQLPKFRELHITEIYNLACPASPIHYQKDPIQTMKCCTFGVLNLLELAHLKGAKILQASTSEIYGDPLVHPQGEDYLGNVNPIGIRACYDEGKRCAETLLFDYYRHYGVSIKVARIFNTFGPKMQKDDGRVVSNFICQALLGNALSIYGTGTQTRSFCYVDDLIEGLILLMGTSSSCTGPMNLGNPVEFTIEELAAKILSLTESQSSIETYLLPLDDPKKRRPDISLAEQTFGWHPKVSLEEGLKKTIEYFRKKLKKEALKPEGQQGQILSRQAF